MKGFLQGEKQVTRIRFSFITYFLPAYYFLVSYWADMMWSCPYDRHKVRVNPPSSLFIKDCSTPSRKYGKDRHTTARHKLSKKLLKFTLPLVVLCDYSHIGTSASVKFYRAWWKRYSHDINW